MKKISIILIIFTLIFSLASCGGVDDINVSFIQESSTSTSLVYQVSISEKISDIEALEEIAYNVASQLYEENFDSIGTNHVVLTINLSNSSSDTSYGFISFDINKTVEMPGLSLNTNDLSLS